MGLDCSHGAWRGAYSAFNTWRTKLAQVAGLPPLHLMQGFYQPLGGLGFGIPTFYHGVNTGEPAHGVDSRPYLADIDDSLPIMWESLKPSPLFELLYHSDCDGDIPAENCESIADALELLIPLLPAEDNLGHIGNWENKTQQFVDGLRAAAKADEPLDFH